MHRGSSNGARATPGRPETLPLSASPALVSVTFVIERSGRTERRTVSVPRGTLVRAALRRLELAPEGSAVLDGPTPLPLDEPLDEDRELTVIPTFSGG